MEQLIHDVAWWFLVIGFCLGVGIAVVLVLISWKLRQEYGRNGIFPDTELTRAMLRVMEVLATLWIADLVFWTLLGIVSYAG